MEISSASTARTSKGVSRSLRSTSNCFVVTHRPAETIVKKGGTSYIFVTDGIEAALERARQAAGSQDVQINGGADIAQQFLNAGLTRGHDRGPAAHPLGRTTQAAGLDLVEGLDLVGCGEGRVSRLLRSAVIR